MIEVEDHGPGVAPEDEEKIFDTRYMRSYTVDEFESELEV